MTTPTIPWTKPGDLKLVDGAEYLIIVDDCYCTAVWSDRLQWLNLTLNEISPNGPNITAAVRLTPYEETI